MRIAVISDIHSNSDALEAVLKDISIQQVQAIISLGDNIGYGPDPEQVIRLLETHRVLSVLGNHERACLDPIYRHTFNPFALEALQINLRLLSERSMDFIRSLPRVLLRHHARFVHGCPPNSLSTYIFRLSDDRITSIMEQSAERISFVGHTHQSRVYELTPDGLHHKNLSKHIVLLAKTYKYIINTPSTGQPRDGYNKARYLIWDPENHNIEPRVIPYDIQATLEKMKKAGIPRIYTLLFEKATA